MSSPLYAVYQRVTHVTTPYEQMQPPERARYYAWLDVEKHALAAVHPDHVTTINGRPAVKPESVPLWHAFVSARHEKAVMR